MRVTVSCPIGCPPTRMSPPVSPLSARLLALSSAVLTRSSSADPSPSVTGASWCMGLSNAMIYTALRNHSSYTRGTGAEVWHNASAPGVQGTVQSVSSLLYPQALLDGVVGLLTCFIMFPSLLLLPWFADRILYEREEDLHHMMRSTTQHNLNPLTHTRIFPLPHHCSV